MKKINIIKTKVSKSKNNKTIKMPLTNTFRGKKIYLKVI